MKVLLISPPIEDFYCTPQRTYPLGILYVASWLTARGGNVRILNALESDKKITLKVPCDFNYLRRYYRPDKSPFCLFSNYYHFGLTYPEIEVAIRQYRPDIVGISSNFSPYFDTSRHVAQLVKYIDNRIPVALGGRFPTASPGLALRDRNVDFVIRGEGEHAFDKLCTALSRGSAINHIKGLCYKTNQRLHISPVSALIKNLDDIPFPDRNLIDYRRYIFNSTISTSLISSRGCMLRCKFCAIHEKFRSRSAENVFKEVLYCYRLGIRHFNFEDDNITVNPYFHKTIDYLIDNFSGKITVSFMNGLAAQGLGLRLRKKLVRIGLTHLDVSLVTSDNGLRLQAQRPHWQKSIFSLSGFMARHSIAPTVHFIIALPAQTFVQALADVKLLAKKPVRLGPSIFYPVIESGFFSQLKKDFGFHEENYKFFRSSCAYSDRYMTRDEIFTIFYFSRAINFIKNLIDNKVIKEHALSSGVRETKLINGAMIVPQRLSRQDLGIILLEKLMREKTAYRVAERQENNQFCYSFLRNDFITARHVQQVFDDLSIRGLSGRAIKI